MTLTKLLKLINFQELVIVRSTTLTDEDIAKLSIEYRQLVLNPKVTDEGDERIAQIMKLAVSNEVLSDAINEIDMNIAVSIGAIPPQTPRDLASASANQ